MGRYGRGCELPPGSLLLGRLIAFVVPLGLDTFAVAAALGLQALSPPQRMKVSLLFAAFEGATSAIGLLLGDLLGHAIGGAAELFAGGLLFLYGLYVCACRNLIVVARRLGEVG